MIEINSNGKFCSQNIFAFAPVGHQITECRVKPHIVTRIAGVNNFVKRDVFDAWLGRFDKFQIHYQNFGFLRKGTPAVIQFVNAQFGHADFIRRCLDNGIGDNGDKNGFCLFTIPHVKDKSDFASILRMFGIKHQMRTV